ncbi:MAG TPA: hypothetical protein VF707_06560 [Ardenticatenaceae bacterium]|jgi:hypothetical protein
MMNIYNGNVVLDASGEAVVDMPAYSQATNRDFRSQLTPIGGFAPLYIAQKIGNNQFRIAGGMRAGSLAAGDRHPQDAWANENQTQVKEPEPED